MFHAQIAQRAFNTPLLAEPSKAMAFLSGLGPRVRFTTIPLEQRQKIAAAPRLRQENGIRITIQLLFS